MALAYDSGVATDQDDLLELLDTFCCVENNWVKDELAACSESHGTGSGEVVAAGEQLHIHRTDSYGETVYFHLYSCWRAKAFPHDYLWSGGQGSATFLGITTRHYQNWGIAIMGSRGYNAGHGAHWHDHTTPSVQINGSGTDTNGACLGFCFGQSLPYWFFMQGDSVHVVVEVFPNEFQHLSFGTLIKSGDYVGGQYYCASNCQFAASDHPTQWASNLESNPWGCDTLANDYASSMFGVYAETETYGWTTNHSGTIYPGTQTSGTLLCGIPRCDDSTSENHKPYLAFMSCSPSTLTSLSPQLPLYVYRKRSDIAGYNLLGSPEGVRFLNMQALSPHDETTYGGDTWHVVPAAVVEPLINPAEARLSTTKPW